MPSAQNLQKFCKQSGTNFNPKFHPQKICKELEEYLFRKTYKLSQEQIVIIVIPLLGLISLFDGFRCVS